MPPEIEDPQLVYWPESQRCMECDWGVFRPDLIEDGNVDYVCECTRDNGCIYLCTELEQEVARMKGKIP